MLRRLNGLFVATLILCTAAFALADEDVRAFAQFLGLDDPDGLVMAVEEIRDSGWLPDHYVRKGEARDLGWYPGRDLCEVAPFNTIGGDRFQNREGLLPDRRGRQWYEADLDFDCGRRGAKRLVFSNDGLIYVTLDHYESFIEVPE